MNGRMIGNNELERMGKEEVLKYFTALREHVLERTEESQ
jgi:hypothetical protein